MGRTVEESAGVEFGYENLSGRPSGPVVRTLSRVSRGVRSVLAQVPPYAAAWRADNAAALERVRDGAPLWVALGDSMTTGIGASAHDRGWVGQVLPDLRALDPVWSDLVVVNLSFSGARVPDVLMRQLPAYEDLVAPALAGRRPALVTLMAGSNDLIGRRWRDGVVAATGAALDRLPAADAVVVANQPGGRRAAQDLNRLLDARAAAGDVTLADFRDPRMRSWKGKLAADFFHPNDLGYAGMAEIVREAVAEARRQV